MTGKELIKILLKDGWDIDRIKGSHYIMKKNNQIEIIPYHTNEIKTGLLNEILKRTGLK